MLLGLALQIWGEKNISQLNSTSNVIVGPQYIDVTIRDGRTEAVGECTGFWCAPTQPHSVLRCSARAQRAVV